MDPETRLRRKNEFDASLVVGSRRFNLATGRDAHLKQREMVAPRFIDPATQNLRSEISAARACPVCGATETNDLFVKDGFRHVRCRDCALIYVNPIVTANELHRFYASETSYTQVLMSDWQQSLDEKRFAYSLDVLAEYVIPPGRMLDVGCGPGTFLRVAKARGWRVEGIEFNQACVTSLREQGIEVVDVPLERATLEDGSYQCIALWDVLEHIGEPSSFVGRLRNLLCPGGILMIEVPHVDSLVSRLLHQRSASFAGDSHINFFTLPTLTRLLEQNGLVVKEAETLITELGAINNHLRYDDPYFGEGETVLDCLTPKFIHDHLLGARLFMLAGR